MNFSRDSRHQPIRLKLSSAPEATDDGNLPAKLRLSQEGEAFLRAELKRQPEIRSEVVSRARVLVRDPEYPSISVLRDIAEQILRAPDPSEEEA